MIIKGTKINDRYAIIRTLGEGGMANVYLAYDTILDRNVAVKVLRGDLANDEKFVRRFQREALSASSLNHPNIVEMYDVGEDDGQYYIVMEYVEGKTLKQLLKRRGSLTITEVIDIMSQLTDGMAHAHDSYIIHRDIKPQNIMILENGLIKITDFGIAMALNSTQLTQTNSVMGSVHYLPPEQANGKGSTIRSDIYSMGILMYELLTGGVPYKGENAVEIALKHLKETLPSIRKKLPELPQSVENIILKATAKNPQNRYKDAREMYQDIVTALDESRSNEKRYVYPYSESDQENTKVLNDAVKEISVREKREVEEMSRNDNQKQNKLLIILASIFTGLVVLTATVVLLLPKLTKNKEFALPDVSNLSQKDASNKLTKAGLTVKCSEGDYEYIPSDEVKENYAVKTVPAAGTLVKKGKQVCLYLSSGDTTFEMPDYITEKYTFNEVQKLLTQMYNCKVSQEIQKVKEEDKIEAGRVVKTVPAAGESVKLGSEIIIYIAEIEVLYPDFTTYTVDQLNEFVNKHKLKLSITYIENSLLPPGTITYQDRQAGSVVVMDADLNVTVTKNPEIVDDIILPDGGENNDNENQGNE